MMARGFLLYMVFIGIAASWLAVRECFAGAGTSNPSAKHAGWTTEGYRPHESGAVRIWDANEKYTMKHYDMRAWKDRANWSQVPYGVTDYQFTGDCILEGENFWISLHSSPHDAVFLYAKTDAEATPGRHNEMYRVFDTPNGLRNYGSGSQYCRILKNIRGEAMVYSEAITYNRGGFETTVTTIYRILGGKSWFEIRPVKQADEQGMHGESRFVLAPEASEDGSDFVDDSLKRSADYVCCVPNRAKMLLDLIMDDDTIWLLMCADLQEGTQLKWPDTRFYAGNAPGGWHAGWSRIGEGDCDRVWTAPFALFAGQPVYIGVLRIGYWHYQKITAEVKAGKSYYGTWKMAYKRQIRSSPFEPGGAWYPLYPGKWRLTGCVDGEYYTNEVTVKADEQKADFSFTSPVDGTLEYIIFYLYDRTEETPEEVNIPMDIYRAEKDAPAVGPRGSVGSDVPLSDIEEGKLARRIVVEGFTAAAVQAACERAVKENVGVVFLPTGRYVFEKEVSVPGGLTVLGEGSGTVCQAEGKSSHLFRVDGDNVRFTRLRLQGADTTISTDNDTYGISVHGKRDVRIDHCELLGFSYATSFGSEATAQVDHCHIHHNLRDGLGYGVAIYSGAYVLITDNEFSQNRHSLASNGALDWSSPMQLGRYVHKTGIRKTHWEFTHNRIGSNDESHYELCAVDTHPGMDGTFVVEANVFENLRHGVGIRDGSGFIRGNVFRNLRTVTNFRSIVAISINYGEHNNIPVEGCMPHNIKVDDNVFLMEDSEYEEYSVGKAENIVIDGELVPETKADRPAPPLPLLVPMDAEGELKISERKP